MNAVVFDASAAVWSLDPAVFGRTQKPGSTGHKLREYYDELTSLYVPRILPAPALAEALAFFYPPDEHETAIRMFHAGFEVHAFDARAASVAARLWKQHDGAAISKLLKQSHKVSGQCVKVDFQIMAIAMIAKAALVLSADGDIKDVCLTVGVAYLHPQDCKPTARVEIGTQGLFDKVLDDTPEPLG